MDKRITQLEAQVNELRGDAIEHKTILKSLDTSMKSVAETMSDMGKVLAANEVREESHQEFKTEVISKLNQASTVREVDRETNRKFHSSTDKRVSLIEQSNRIRDIEVDSLKKAKSEGLSAWKSTGLTLIISTVLIVISILIKGAM